MEWQAASKRLQDGRFSARDQKKGKASPLTRLRGVDGIRTRDEGFADPCLTTWPRRRSEKKRAGDGIRTHDLLLGKETFYH